MERDSILFLKASLIRHHVTRWQEMVGQRFSAVHVTQDNMANFKDVALPPDPAQKRESQMAAKANDTITECPFCKKPHYEDRTNLYTCNIESTKGVFHCFRCGDKGSWFDFKNKVM